LFFPSASFLDTEPKGEKQVHVCVGHKAHNDVHSGIILQCKTGFTTGHKAWADIMLADKKIRQSVSSSGYEIKSF